tara:strand:+ start:8904 stop:9131 length:228 start_codon:yes stop_codon:yes gene_type:complete
MSKYNIQLFINEINLNISSNKNEYTYNELFNIFNNTISIIDNKNKIYDTNYSSEEEPPILKINIKKKSKNKLVKK